ncbi:MAG: TIM barrel protein [Mariniphaga sp.]
MKKRMTVKMLLFVAITALLTQVFAGCNPPKEKYIGLQLWSVREDMKKDAATTIAKIGEMGYKFVEPAGYNDGKFYGLSPADFKQLCETNGIQILSSHTGHHLPDSANWDATMAWWDQCIDAHLAAGAKYIVKPSMGKTGYSSLEGLKRTCEYFNQVGEKCNAKGIRFGYHNHSNEFTTVLEGKPVYDWMLELTDPEKVMFQLDLYWIVVGGKDPLDYFDRYPGRFELWHLKDEKELGESGKMDFESIFAQRQKSGAKYGIVEVEKYNFEPLESCRISLEFLKNAPYVDFY